MGPLRKSTQHVFRTDDRQRIGFEGSIQRRENHRRIGPSEYLRTGREEGGNVGNMFHDLHVEDYVEGFSPCGQVFRRRLDIVDFKSRFRCMQPRDLDVLFRGVDADDVGA